MSYREILANLDAELNPSTRLMGYASTNAAMQLMHLDLLGDVDDDLSEDAVAIANIDGALLAIEETTCALEDYLNTFESSIADGGITKQTYNALVTGVTRDCGIAGQVFSIYAAESIDKVGGRLEVTTEAMKGIKDSIASAWKKTVALFNSLIDAVVKFFNKHISKVGRFKKKADALATIAKDLKGAPGKDDKVTISKDFFIDTKPAKLKDLQDLNKMLKSYVKDKGVEVALKSLGKAYGEAKTTTDAEAQASIQAIDSAVNTLADAIETSLNITGDLKDLNPKSVPKEDEYETVKATDIFIGNFKIVLGKPGSKTDRMPTVIVLPTMHKVKEEEIVALGKSDIEAYSSAVSELADNIIVLSEGFDKKPAKEVLAGATKLVAAAKDAEISKTESDAIKQRVKQVRTIAKLCREPAVSLSTRLAAVGVAAYTIAYKSAKAHKEE